MHRERHTLQYPFQPQNQRDTRNQSINRAALISAIVCTSLFGNVLVLMVFHRKPQLLHVANRFVFNLLLADLFQTVLVMPLVIAGSLPEAWPFLDTGLCCKALVVLMHLFAFAGVNTIVVVSIDRYLAIIHPLSYPARMTPRRGSSLILLTWFLGAAQSAPPLFGWGQIGFDRHHLCSLFWSASHSYTVVIALLTFWLPVTIMLGCYWMVFRAARRQNALVHPTHHYHHHHHLLPAHPNANAHPNPNPNPRRQAPRCPARGSELATGASTTTAKPPGWSSSSCRPTSSAWDPTAS
eukprot:gi/632936199/ref/XP_007892906.1/ PREDICTED: probable G-protein coupled receptor 101 [Callorhinchus milii]